MRRAGVGGVGVRRVRDARVGGDARGGPARRRPGRSARAHSGVRRDRRRRRRHRRWIPGGGRISRLSRLSSPARLRSGHPRDGPGGHDGRRPGGDSRLGRAPSPVLVPLRPARVLRVRRSGPPRVLRGVQVRGGSAGIIRRRGRAARRRQGRVRLGRRGSERGGRKRIRDSFRTRLGIRLSFGGVRDERIRGLSLPRLAPDDRKH
mmetsp:Transcript_6759/g.26322  ORF Transcript_6759/g.26322 Transcript_6759/m.26322 type:complete len:205 (-) Transcript_6759:1600-2214(-)